MTTSDNDGRFPDDSRVETRYPLTREQHDGDRDTWPWLPGTIQRQCGPDEWQVWVEVPELAVRKDGSKPTPPAEPVLPAVLPGRLGDPEGIVNRQDAGTRRTTTAIVAAVALFAAGDSFTHIYDLARAHGQGAVSAALLPLAGDGLIAAASSAMLAAARSGMAVPARARVLLIGGIAATIAANVAYGLPSGVTNALLSVWPVACYVGCVEILSWMRQNLGASARPRTASTTRTVPGASAASGSPDADGPQDELRDRRERKTRQPVGELLALAEKMFPGGMNDGKPASLRDIQGALSVGQGKAQVVQAHFRTLATG